MRPRNAAQRAHDHPRQRAGFLLPARQTAQYRLHHLVQGQAAPHVQRRTKTRFDVPHTIEGCVEDELMRDALERDGILHRGQRHLEARQIILEMAGIVHPHPGTERRRRRLGKREAALAREFQQCRWPQRAVEMAVQIRLRQALDDLDERGIHGAHDVTSTSPGSAAASTRSRTGTTR